MSSLGLPAGSVSRGQWSSRQAPRLVLWVAARSSITRRRCPAPSRSERGSSHPPRRYALGKVESQEPLQVEIGHVLNPQVGVGVWDGVCAGALSRSSSEGSERTPPQRRSSGARLRRETEVDQLPGVTSPLS